ncbi:MAG: hypoxanthine phosphoribosyltransferase [Myxococcales bacterium]|nr:hypoxanthine phosphoribosyltransferase [Myxococcales bacterium]MCB9691720.1 hypoxanthine phosphoribosyltransferase [Alphaproteobacteria bacterium]
MPTLEPMISAEQLATRIQELGAGLARTYADEPVVVIGVLKGSFLFMADLVRAMDCDVRCHFLGVASYEGTESTGKVRITHDLDVNIEGRHVLVVEDIVDTGLTLAYIREMLAVRQPASLAVCALLDKPERRKVEVEVEHVGFTIPDAFVVGYGLDLDQRYRNLPYVAVYHPDGA